MDENEFSRQARGQVTTQEPFAQLLSQFRFDSIHDFLADLYPRLDMLRAAFASMGTVSELSAANLKTSINDLNTIMTQIQNRVEQLEVNSRRELAGRSGDRRPLAESSSAANRGLTPESPGEYEWN